MKNSLFEEIRKNIREDNDNISDDEMFHICEDNNEKISVIDNMEQDLRFYTITNPDRINKGWLEERLIITESANTLPYVIAKNRFIEWMLDTVDKSQYMDLEKIIFVNDIEKDANELIKIDPELKDILMENDLPDEGCMGIMWYFHQIIIVNIREVIRVAVELGNELHLREDEILDEVDIGTSSTVVHEIRHLAQANPYIPEEMMNQKEDNETDAENYARGICTKAFGIVKRK